MSAIKTVTVNGTTYDINDARITLPNNTTTFFRGDGTWQTVQTSGASINIAATTTSGGYPILFSPTSAARDSWVDAATTTVKTDPAIAVNPAQSRLVIRSSTYSNSSGSGSGFDLYDVASNKFMGVFQTERQGTASTTGVTMLTLGNNTASGTAGNAHGILYMYGDNSGWVGITTTVGSTSRNYTIPDAGAAADFVMTAGNQTIAGNKTFSGVVTLNNSLVGKYTTTLNTTASVQANNIFSGTPTAAGATNQIAFVIVS